MKCRVGPCSIHIWYTYSILSCCQWAVIGVGWSCYVQLRSVCTCQSREGIYFNICIWIKRWAIVSYSLQSQWGARAAHHNTIGYTPIHPPGIRLSQPGIKSDRKTRQVLKVSFSKFFLILDCSWHFLHTNLDCDSQSHTSCQSQKVSPTCG